MKSDFTELNAFMKTLKSGKAVDVGIFSNRASRKGKDGRKNRALSGNPDIGAVHEFGSFTKHIPARSFLRMPLLAKTETILERVKKNMLLHLSKGNIDQVLRDLGIACEEMIYRAFTSSGFGTWMPIKDPSRGKKNWRGQAKPLLDTGQLQRSITSRVVQK